MLFMANRELLALGETRTLYASKYCNKRTVFYSFVRGGTGEYYTFREQDI